MHLSGYAHEPGRHCGSTSLRNLATYYNWGFSEAESFGLASGLGFTYLHTSDSPYRIFLGRPLWMESAFFSNLDIPHVEREGQEKADAWGAVETAIDADKPVMAFVDLFYLDYYGTDTHFAPHIVLLVGYDEETVQISDSEFDELQTVSREDFEQAWTSQAMVPLSRRYIVVTDPEPQATLEQAARQAIQTAVAYMQDPDTSPWPLGAVDATHGLAGLHEFAAELPEFTSLGDCREVTWTARFAYQMVERRGTGGGSFRRLYAEFLDSMADVLPEITASHGERMHEIADDWTVVGAEFKAASRAESAAELRTQFVELSDAVADLAAKEDALIADLDAALAE
ncbi:BtrH N-terminal domain-containing protein [Haladaptatus sp. DJG-WS-42]|uniref:BtrH N-terminal domain-containing protein n=1 Tax=Haladaptatus sp. DJG-WS-42 TaxID=3120516 RepID=UPI0030D536C6